MTKYLFCGLDSALPVADVFTVALVAELATVLLTLLFAKIFTQTSWLGQVKCGMDVRTGHFQRDSSLMMGWVIMGILFGWIKNGHSRRLTSPLVRLLSKLRMIWKRWSKQVFVSLYPGPWLLLLDPLFEELSETRYSMQFVLQRKHLNECLIHGILLRPSKAVYAFSMHPCNCKQNSQ